MSNFVDECSLNVRGGDGGAGCVSFRREAHTPRGGPDGGDGGSGGDIWLVADHNTASLLAFRDHPHRRAPSGTHGKGAKRHGHRGEDLIVLVPIGTQVFDWEGVPLADLVGDGDRWLAAAGGQGGKGNARFLSNKRRAPGFAEQGEHGEERWIRLELKLMADVALVGFPNVGKSTLISRISAARPKIADYPFTTLEPNLGVVRTDDGFEMVVADIPGLIEGAAEGRGLGHRFLRHIERASVLVLLLDLSPFAGATWSEQEATLLRELGDYQPDLVTRPRLRVGSRADLADPGRLCWYVRIAELPPTFHPLSSVLRLEAPGALPMARAVTLADEVTSVLPRLASSLARDPRAPQNLVPVGALEAQLTHRLGDREWVRRALTAHLASAAGSALLEPAPEELTA